MAGKIKIKRGTTAQWADSSTNDITLAPGQPGVEYCEDGKTKLKIGPHTEDGSSTEWDKIDYISTDGTEIVKTSTTGKNYIISDCAEETIVSLNGYGESIQNGTPTPDSPVEIVSVENPVISIYGKNLIPFPYNVTSREVNGITYTVNDDGTVIVNGTATADSQLTLWGTSKIKVFAGIDYTISGCPSGGSAQTYYFRVRAGGITYQDVGNGFTSKALTNSTTGEYITIVVKQGATANNLIFKPQFQIGTTVTPYEPYIEPQTVTVPYKFAEGDMLILNNGIVKVNISGQETDITDTETGQELLALKLNYPVTSVISDIDCNIEYLTVDSIVDQKYNPNSVYPQSGRAVAEAISSIPSGVRPARIVIGTSKSGYTRADCDYLCGRQASDSDTIQLAINDLKAAGGGEILFLDGDYLVGPLITIQDVNISIKGSGIVTFHQQNTSTVATDGMFKITSSTSTNELYEVVFDNVRFLGLGNVILPPDNYQPSAINCITNTASLTIRNCVADGFDVPGTAAFVCGNGLLPRVTNTFENNKIINSYTAIRSYVQYGDLEIINNDIAVHMYGIDFENYTYKDIYIVGNNISVSSGSMSDTSYCVYFPSDFNFSGGCELVIKNNTLICGASYSGAIMLQNLPSDYKRKNMIDSNLFTTANNTTPSLTSRGIYLLPTLHKKVHGLSISNNIFESLGTGIQYTTTLSGTPGVEPKNIITNNIFNNLVGSCIDIYGKGITTVSNNIGTTLADSAFVGESYVTYSTNNIWNGVPSFSINNTIYPYLNSIPWYTGNTMSTYDFAKACPNHCDFVTTINKDHHFSDSPLGESMNGIMHVYCGSANYREFIIYRVGGATIYFGSMAGNGTAINWRQIVPTSIS